MTFNEGMWDRMIRTVIGVALGYAGWTAWPEGGSLVSSTGMPALVYLLVGCEVLITAMIGWSPVYALFGLSTKEKVGA